MQPAGDGNMKIRIWGARGSIPVSGPEYVTFGGDTTCLELRGANDEILIVDAGSGIRRLGNWLMQEGRRDFTMIFTHSHWDHILGFPFFKPLHEPDTCIRLYGCPMEQGNMQSLISKTMAGPYFPVPYEAIQGRIDFQTTCMTNEWREIAGLEIATIPLSHPNMGLGYKFRDANNATVVLLTDNELRHTHRGGKSFEEYVEFCRNADLMIHDAEYTEAEYSQTKGWGHSTFQDALDLAVAAEVKRFCLFHHNQDRHDSQLLQIVMKCRQIISELGADIRCFAATQETELEI